MQDGGLSYRSEDQINRQTGTPEYYNINKKSPKTRWDEFRTTASSQSPFVENVGGLFQDYGGVKPIDNDLSYSDLYDIEEGRAQAQSGIGLVARALGQSVNEAVLGTIEGAGYMGDIPGTAKALFLQNEKDFDNWLSKPVRELKKYINEEYFPVYMTKAAKDGALFDRTALAAGAKNIATSVGIMIPSLAVARGINVLGRIAGMSGRALTIAESIGAAGASRIAEGTMEAQQFGKQYTSKYREEISKKYEQRALDEISKLPLVMPPNEYGFSPYSAEQRQIEERRIIDKYKAQIDAESSVANIEGMNNVFKANAVLSIVDAFQFAPIMKAINKGLTSSTAGRVVENFMLQPITETGEEVYQSGIQSEAFGSFKAKEKMFGPGFSERFREYLKSDEAEESAFWGALGGGVFAAAGPLIKKSQDMAIDAALYMNRVKSYEDLERIYDNDLRASYITRHLKRGRIDNLETDIDFIEKSVSAIKDEDFATDGTDKTKTLEFISSLKQDIAFAKAEKIRLDNNEDFNLSERAKVDYIDTNLRLKNNAISISEIDKSLKDEYRTVETQVSRDLLEIKKIKEEINANKKVLQSINKISSFKKNSEYKNTAKEALSEKISALEENLKEKVESYKSNNKKADLLNSIKTTADNSISDKEYAKAELTAINEYAVKPKLRSYEKIEFISKVESELKKEEELKSSEFVKTKTKAAETPEEIDEIIEAAPEEDVQELDRIISDKADEEAIDAPTDPGTRYEGRPNLFTQEMNNLEGNVLFQYDGQLPDSDRAELDMIIMSQNAEEFVNNYNSLAAISAKDPNKARLFDTIKSFYEGLNKNKEDVGLSSNVKPDANEPIVDNDEEVPIVGFYEGQTTTSDIGYTPTGESKSSDISPNRAVIREYEMTAGRIKVLNGIPVENSMPKSMNINWDYLNSEESLREGSEIYFVVNLDETIGKNKSQYHKNLKDEDFINKAQILIAQKDQQGNEQIVNALPSYSANDKSVEGLKLKALRDKIWQDVKSSNKRTGKYDTGIATKVTKKYAGRILVSKTKQAPHKVIKNGDKLILGIATEINGVVSINAGKEVSAEYSGITVDSKNKGGVFILTRGANGRIVPARCFTKKIESFPKLYEEAKSLLLNSNKDNWANNREELRKIVYLDYNYNPKTDSFEVYFGAGRVNTFNKTQLDDLLKGKIVQVSLSEINKGDYNNRISEEGRISTDLNPFKHIANANFEFSLDYYSEGQVPTVTVLPTEADAIVMDTIDNEPELVLPGEDIKQETEVLTPTEESKDDFDSLEDFENPLGTFFSKVNPSKDRNFYQKWDELKETKWFKDRFDESLIDVDAFRNGLIEVNKNGGFQAYGMFKNAVAYISGSAKSGTTYHEAFHVVFHLYLNNKERSQILDEASAKYKIDRSNEIELEEKLADSFMEYVQTEEQSTEKLSTRIKAFFRHLYQLIKSRLTADLTIENLFYRAQKGYYKTKPFSRDVSKFNVVRYSIPGFTLYEQERRAISLADFMRKSLDFHINNNPEYKSLSRRDVLDRMMHKTKTGSSLKGIDLIALGARANIIKAIKENTGLSPEQKANAAKMLNNFIAIGEDGGVKFLALGKEALKQFSRTEGIKIKLSDKSITKLADSSSSDEAALFELQGEDIMGEAYSAKAENISSKESLSNEVRKELSYIPRLNSNGTEVTDDLGFTVYQDFNTVYADLLRDLSDINDSEDMIERLDSIGITKPYLSVLINKTKTDDLFRSKMFVNFAKSHVRYTTVAQYKNSDTNTTEYRILGSNRMRADSILVDEWKDNSTDSLFNKTIGPDGKYISSHIDALKKLWNNISVRSRGKSSLDNAEINNIARALNYAGITITVEDLQSWNKNLQNPALRSKRERESDLKFKQHLDVIMSKLFSGVNPFEATSFESEAISSVAQYISKFRSELMESSFKNAENNTVYSHQVPSFLSRTIAQFKGKNAENKIKWYQSTAFYKESPWLKELESVESRDNFEFTEIDAIRYDNTDSGVRYTSMSEKDFENTAIHMYFNNGAKNYVYYKFPVVSDAPKMPFIKFKRYTQKDVVNKLYDVYRQEWARINNVKAREAARNQFIAEGKEIPDELKVIKNYDNEKSKRFIFLPFLNTGHARKYVESKNEAGIKQSIIDFLNTEAKIDLDRLNKLGVFSEKDGITEYDSRIISNYGSVEAFHKDYFMNSFLANTQMMSIFSGDPAFYKADKSAQSIYSRTVDYQKRNKQNVSPKQTIDVNAVYTLTEEQSKIEGKNQVLVSKQYNSIYIKDYEAPSNFAEEIYNAIVGDNISFSEEDLEIQQKAADIAGAYGYNSDNKINVTDAQAYITLPRYREIMIGLTRWNDDLQEIYPRLLNGTASNKDLQVVMQPIKPFYFGHTKAGDLIIPTQNKNSEFLLLPQLVKGSKELSKLYDYMIKNNISSANFNSAVKAGEFGAQDIDNIEKASIHILNNEDYGLQQETPEHYLDSNSLFGSQIRKIILSDISDDQVFDIDGKEFTKAELVNLYQDIIKEDLKESFDKVANEFGSIEKLKDLILSEIVDRDLGEERERAVELVNRINKETGLDELRFNLPLFHPYHAKQIESLLNSVFKNNVTKQKIKGGAFVQVSSFGFSNELKLILDGERLVGAEVYLPWWSKKFFEPLLNENGQLDINRVPMNLREMIGYRIPTEDKYSMLPLVVKGFLPAGSGGAVMLPMEITTISGSDFDIDKMYIMMPEFEKIGDDIVKTKYDYNKESSVQSKQARNNAKIDIIRAILSSHDTVAKIFKPGGFPTLDKLALNVLKLEGKADEMLPIALPSTQTELFKRNMTGKKLIGIFANHNANHAVLQYTQIGLASPIELNGESYASLHEVKNKNGDFISRNGAEWLAAVVDNAKNPLSSFINVNTYTADVAAMLTRLGFNLDTVVYFMSQPSLKEFSRLYFLYGANKQAENKAKAEILGNFAKIKATDKKPSFTNAEFISAISDKNIYTNFQYSVFNNFNYIKDMSKALADLVRATRADTKGAGPTLSENESLIRLRQEVMDNLLLINHQDLLTGEVYPMEEAFMWYGIERPTQILSKYFPWTSPAFNKVKDRISKQIKSQRLTVSQIEKINYELLGYAATGFEFFDGTDRSQIINGMAKKVRAFKSKYPEKYGSNFFVNKLIFKKDDKNASLPERVQFKNTGSLTDLDKQQIKKHWNELMVDPDLAIDKEFNTFAKDLVKYAFYTAGFQLTPNSFSHLIPVDFYSNLTDSNGQTFNEYLDKFWSESKNEEAYNEFIEQFFRNNYNDLSLVPAVDTKDFSNISGNVERMNGKPVYFKVTDSMALENRDLIVKKDEFSRTFAPFVSLLEKGNIYLFKKVDENGASTGYVLTEKLGIPGHVLEYEKNNISPKSVVSQNNVFIKNFTQASILEKFSKDEEQKKINASDIIEPVKSSDSSITSMAEITNHSGGAIGTDIEWDKIGRQFGVVRNNHYYMGNKTPHGNIKISKSDEIEGQQKVTMAARQMGRIEKTHQVRDTKLIRNWAQVKYSDAIFAVTTMLNPGDEMNYGKKALIPQGKGGTGYAIQMAINEGKPVYVFDQVRNNWYSNINGKWSKSEIPILTKNFAGIGTREINQNGLNAIEDVFNKTLSSINDQTQSMSDEYSNITESLRSKIMEQLSLDESLAGYLDITINVVSDMDIEQLGEVLKKICNR